LDDGDQKPGMVLRADMEAGGDVRLAWLAFPERTVAAVARCAEARHLLVPHQRGVLDSEGREHLLAAEVDQLLAGEALDDVAEVDEALARVRDPGAGSERDVQLTRPPVRRTGLVSDHISVATEI
jgi:hypothetical protein